MRRRLIAAGVLVAAVVAAPYVFQAERFRGSIHRGLEESLGRKVEINGAVSYLLLPRPGFSAADVVIHEHPSVGAEPFAYVGTLDFLVSLTGLLRGRVDLAGIRMGEPHINLMKPHQSNWNFQPFLDHALGPKRTGATLPGIQVSNGRLNFKDGDTKSTLYLDATDLTVEADPEAPGRYGIKFDGEPARTDRGVRALGRLTGRGMLDIGSRSGAESRIEFSLSSERTSISEVITLIEGRSVGVRGFVTSRMRLSGPLSAIAIDGRLDVAEFERLGWLLPGGAGSGLQLRGRLNLPDQELVVETVSPPGRPLPVSVRARATKILGAARWAAVVSANDLPLASFRTLLAEAGFGLGTEAAADGKLSGAIGYSTGRGFQGSLLATDASVQGEGLPALSIASAAVAVEGRNLILKPSTVQVGDTRSAVVEARYESGTGNRDVALQTAGLEVAELRPLWRMLAGRPLPDMIEQSPSGSIQGSLRCKVCAEENPEWNADMAIKGLKVGVEGMPSEIEISTALTSLRGNAVVVRRLEARMGPLKLAGEFSLDPTARRPQKFRVSIPEATLPQLESFLRPAFDRSQGIVARTLGRAAPLPEWLASRGAEGSLKIASLRAGGMSLTNAGFQVDWRGAHVEIREWAASVGGGSMRGKLTVDLEGREPIYKGRVDFAGFPWQEGELDAQVDMASSGIGAQIVSRLKLQGTFAAREFALAPDLEWRQASGSFVYAGAAVPRLLLTGIEAAIGADSYQGQGNSNAEGRLTVELTSAQKQLRLAGRISGLQVELSPTR